MRFLFLRLKDLRLRPLPHPFCHNFGSSLFTTATCSLIRNSLTQMNTNFFTFTVHVFLRTDPVPLLPIQFRGRKKDTFLRRFFSLNLHSIFFNSILIRIYFFFKSISLCNERIPTVVKAAQCAF